MVARAHCPQQHYSLGLFASRIVVHKQRLAGFDQRVHTSVLAVPDYGLGTLVAAMLFGVLILGRVPVVASRVSWTRSWLVLGHWSAMHACQGAQWYVSCSTTTFEHTSQAEAVMKCTTRHPQTTRAVVVWSGSVLVACLG